MPVQPDDRRADPPFEVDRCESWQHFKSRLDRYSLLSAARKRQLIFRGQADANWRLQTTLDRHRVSRPDLNRDACSDLLMRNFRRLALGMGAGCDDLSDSELQYLARHHGLPTPVLDWTESPYIAAFFAFDDDLSSQSGEVAIWVLDRDVFTKLQVPDTELKLVEGDRVIQFNPRAIEQQAVFLEVLSAESSLETRLGDALGCFRIPSEFRRIALAELESMNISPRSMFRDLDAAARGAARRVLFLEEIRRE